MLEVYELLKATDGRLISGGKDITIRGISIDSRTINPQEAFIAIKGSKFDGHDFINEAIKKGASCIIKEAKRAKFPSSKGTPRVKKVTFIEVRNTVRALADIARFKRRKFDIPVIAVTGSNGKTTTKEMIAGILSKRFKVLKNEGTKNNHIGLPMTLLNLNSDYDIAVLEIGTNHFGEVQYLTRVCLPNIGIITNIGLAHLEYLHDLKGVFREKYALIENLKKPYIAILNADDPFLRRVVIKKNKRPFILGFGIKNKSDFSASDIEVIDGEIEFLVNPVRKSHTGKIEFSNGVNQKYKFTPLDRRSKIDDTYRHLTGFTLKTPGYYNIYNALAAITVARIFGIDYKDIIFALSDFDFLEGRLKIIKLRNIKFIDDTYNSNPVSLKQALNVLDKFRTQGRKIFVMGDMLELGNSQRLFHCRAGRQAAMACDVFITVGELSKLAARAARTCGFNINNIFTCGSTDEARDILFNKVSPSYNDIVLVKGSRAMKMEEVFK